MSPNSYNKREILRLSFGVATGALVSSRALAQGGSLFGVPVPKEILDIIPRKELGYVRLADAVIKLEREADRKDLPDSSLSRNKGQKITSYNDALYQLVLSTPAVPVER